MPSVNEAAGHARGELLRAHEGGVAHGLAGGLDDAGARMRFSISLTSETMQSPLITLSASSTTM